MSYEINVLYPKQKAGTPVAMFAQTEMVPSKIELKTLEEDLTNLVKMLDSLEEKGSRYSIDEVKLGVGITEDSEGKIRVGFAASILSLFKVESSGETGEKLSQNQLLEITIRKK